jgi:hypothetical protein
MRNVSCAYDFVRPVAKFELQELAEGVGSQAGRITALHCPARTPRAPAPAAPFLPAHERASPASVCARRQGRCTRAIGAMVPPGGRRAVHSRIRGAADRGAGAPQTRAAPWESHPGACEDRARASANASANLVLQGRTPGLGSEKSRPKARPRVMTSTGRPPKAAADAPGGRSRQATLTGTSGIPVRRSKVIPRTRVLELELCQSGQLLVGLGLLSIEYQR